MDPRPARLRVTGWLRAPFSCRFFEMPFDNLAVGTKYRVTDTSYQAGANLPRLVYDRYAARPPASLPLPFNPPRKMATPAPVLSDTTTLAPPVGRPRRSLLASQAFCGWLFVLPALVGFTLFYFQARAYFSDLGRQISCSW
jgi:hypothetical protein